MSIEKWKIVKRLFRDHAILRECVRRMVEENDTKIGRLFDIAIEIFIVFSIVIYSLGTLPGLSERWIEILNITDILCYCVFTIEYILRIYVSKRPLKYILSFYGIIDLVTILPFIAGSKFDLRAIRALRIFRIISALKISKYSDAMKRFKIALDLIRPELFMFFIAAGIFIFIAAAGIYHFEHEAQPEAFASVFHGLWWAIVTMTTVGYGDIYPITAGGRIFTFCLLLIGLGIVTIPAGLIASSLSKARQMEEESKQKCEKERVEKELADKQNGEKETKNKPMN